MSTKKFTTLPPYEPTSTSVPSAQPPPQAHTPSSNPFQRHHAFLAQNTAVAPIRPYIPACWAVGDWFDWGFAGGPVAEGVCGGQRGRDVEGAYASCCHNGWC
jgi:hypothetical protein